MKIEEVRPSFTAYLIASEAEALGGVSETLRLAGYMVAVFPLLTAALSEIQSNPPHFVMFSFSEKKFDLRAAIDQIQSQLPESHILMITPIAEREKAAAFLQKGVYDFIFTPILSEVELVRTLDRATERDYFMYLNEQLMQSREAEPNVTQVREGSALFDLQAGGEPLEDLQLDRVLRLFSAPGVDECIQAFLESASHMLGSCPAIYFKYVQNRRLLMVAQNHGADQFQLKGLGLNFNEVAPGFRTVQLRDPMRVEELTGMIREVFETEEFLVFPVEALGEIQGVICFLRGPLTDLLRSTLMGWLELLDKALSLVESSRRLHVVSQKDLVTDVFNRQNFMNKVGEEISRSRRTKLPVSILRIAVDQYGRLTSTFGAEESQVVMRTAAQIIDRHSRVNDILGRLGTDEFGLLLPHTDKQGAMIKAERLRRIFESADFEKVLRGMGRMTVSVGVSEYPSLARDAEELVQSADDAIFQVRKGGNKTCVAKASDGFEPDFDVPVKGT